MSRFVAIAGVTGTVGKELLKCMETRGPVGSHVVPVWLESRVNPRAVHNAPVGFHARATAVAGIAPLAGVARVVVVVGRHGL